MATNTNGLRLALIGPGYVGLPTAITLVEQGHFVTMLEPGTARYMSYAAGRVPFRAPRISEEFRSYSEAGRLSVVPLWDELDGSFSVVVIAVPADTLPNGELDLQILASVLREIASRDAFRGCAVCVRTTLTLGSSAAIIRSHPVIETLCSRYLYWPAFIRQQYWQADFRNPDRIILGSWDEGYAREVAACLMPESKESVHYLTVEEAEFAKQASNSCLAVNQLLTAELSLICEANGVGTRAVLSAIAQDHRLGQELLEVRPGLGDSCLPKDLRAIAKLARDSGILLSAGVERDDDCKRLVSTTVVKHVSNSQRPVVFVGLGYAPEVGDVRGSLSLVLAASLQGSSQMFFWDPYIDRREINANYPQMTHITNIENALEVDGTLLILADHPEVEQAMNSRNVKAGLSPDRVFDFRPERQYGVLLSHNWYSANGCGVCEEGRES